MCADVVGSKEPGIRVPSARLQSPEREHTTASSRNIQDREPDVFFFLFGGKEGNASCTVAPQGAVCETPGRLANLGLTLWTNTPPDLPNETPLRHPIKRRRRLDLF